MTPSIPPTPRTWTLRFKSHRTTVILHVDPLQPLSQVRSELLLALQQTNQISPSSTYPDHRPPEKESDILLARPVDINDLDAGWEAIPLSSLSDELEEEEDDVKGKGKVRVVTAKGTKVKDVLDCPQGAGLRDGGVVAFKFRTQREEEEGEKMSGEERWDVVLPRTEDVEAEGEEEMVEDEGVVAG